MGTVRQVAALLMQLRRSEAMVRREVVRNAAADAQQVRWQLCEYVAFAAGVRVAKVSMMGGVHVLAGRIRTVVEVGARVLTQRNERGGSAASANKR
jgi:hypothetical protein